MSKEMKRIDIKEFREFGFLQELNRQFLHPFGLALEVIVEADGTEKLGGVWDYRDAPEGMIFGEDGPEPEKANRVAALIMEATKTRRKALGYFIQPVTKLPE